MWVTFIITIYFQFIPESLYTVPFDGVVFVPCDKRSRLSSVFVWPHKVIIPLLGAQTRGLCVCEVDRLSDVSRASDEGESQRLLRSAVLRWVP